MNKLLYVFGFFLFVGTANAQLQQIDVDRNGNDSLAARRSRARGQNVIKNEKAKIDMYKIISKDYDTTYVDTTLNIGKDYKFNYLRKDDFDLIAFPNVGQTYNTLSYDFSSRGLKPEFGARARHFNYREIADTYYYRVPTPFTELMFKTTFEQGQLLESFFTVNTSERLNLSIGYKGLRSLGKYQHALTSTGNFEFTTNYRTKNNRYHMRGHITMQDLSNEENGGLSDEDVLEFENGNPEFIERAVFDPLFENAENILEGKRFHLDHYYNIVQHKDSTNAQSWRVGNIVSFEDKYYQYVQTSAYTEGFGDAFSNAIKERTTLEDFYVEANTEYSNTKLGRLKAFVGYTDFNYGYDNLVSLNGTLITNRIKGNVISAGGSYKNTIGALDVEGDVGANVSGDFDGYYVNGKVGYRLNDDIGIVAGISSNSKAPNYNFLLYHSDYVNYNWQNDFDNVKTNQLNFKLASKKYGSLVADYTTITDHAYFQKDADGNVRPFQTSDAINYVRVKFSNELKFGKFALNNTIRYQTVLDGEGILNVPELTTRNTIYYANHFFEKNALFLQAGVTFNYFTSYYMNAYDPVLAEFYVQNQTELGDFPRIDVFVNAKIRQTRIFIKAEHINASFTGYNYYAAPNVPYRDFVLRLGLVWDFFL